MALSDFCSHTCFCISLPPDFSFILSLSLLTPSSHLHSASLSPSLSTSYSLLSPSLSPPLSRSLFLTHSLTISLLSLPLSPSLPISSLSPSLPPSLPASLSPAKRLLHTSHHLSLSKIARHCRQVSEESRHPHTLHQIHEICTYIHVHTQI